ncbi:hypothetical protein F0562_014893 [Nyssa sinensis]|uniref:DUF4378 domain-containing protein n=1 Tax=Nyssa sinensis TaxID=561372 RepID=A0A5J4ZTZ6_9ASTE|nr:hypothetical protein F0562_014893 [Nyssa sinensis]
MAKRSQRRLVRYEKDQAGCMWGLISMFDFRSGRSTRKLLSDRRRGIRQAVGAGYSKSKLDSLTNFDEKCQGIYDGEESETAAVDAGKTSVKELMEEEMFCEHDLKKQMSSPEVEPKESDSEHGHVKKNPKPTNKTSKRLYDIHACKLNAAENLGPENSCHQVSEQKTSNNLDLEVTAEELCDQIHQRSTGCVKHDWHEDLEMHSTQTCSIFEEKISEAIKVLLNHKFSNGKNTMEDGKVHHSREFMDALQTLSSNKELFLKLQRDPNSLLVKHIQELDDAQLEKPQNSKSVVRSSLLDKELGVRNSQTESNLSSSLQSHYNLGNKEQSERIASQFSFTEIKRKLKHVMGKERNGIPSDGITHKFSCEHQNSGHGDGGGGRENAGLGSPNRNHFYSKRFSRLSNGRKKEDKIDKLKDAETTIGNETVGYPEQRVSNIYIEAKKHLLEMLTNGDEIEDSSSWQLPKSLGRILSLPEFNFSPSRSPGREEEHSFRTAQLRSSPCNNFHMVNESTWRLIQENHVSHLGPSSHNLECQSCITDANPDDKEQIPNPNHDGSNGLNHGDAVEETPCSMSDVMSSEAGVEIVKTTDTVFLEESKTLEVLAAGSSIIRDDENSHTAEVPDQQKYAQCLKMDSFEEDQSLSSPLASPSSTSIAKKVEDLESANERPEWSSPVSVLEPLFSEDDISPASTKSLAVEPPMRPLQIHLEEQVSCAVDQGICARTCMEDEESTFEYVEAVLLGSDLNWDEFLLRWLSSNQLLDPSLFDEVELFSNCSCHDQKLLFDCTNEVLTELCERYFGYFQWVSFAKQNILPVPRGKNLIQEVWEGVEWHLLLHPPPFSLDQIVRKDVAKTGKWMDLRFDIESIGIDIGEAILEELMEDTVLSLVKQCPENEFSAIPVELKPEGK